MQIPWKQLHDSLAPINLRDREKVCCVLGACVLALRWISWILVLLDLIKPNFATPRYIGLLWDLATSSRSHFKGELRLAFFLWRGTLGTPHVYCILTFASELGDLTSWTGPGSSLLPGALIFLWETQISSWNGN